MSRNGITYLDVARYAEELTASSTEPTIEQIRIQLKTGSNSTIGKLSTTTGMLSGKSK